MQEVFSFQFFFRTDGRKRERERLIPFPLTAPRSLASRGKKRCILQAHIDFAKAAELLLLLQMKFFIKKKILWLKQLDLLFIWLYALLAGSLLSARCHAMMIYYSASYEKEKRRLNGSFSCEYLRYGLLYTPTKIATRKAPNYASRIYILLILCIG